MRLYISILLSNFTKNKEIHNYMSAKLYVQKKRRIIKIIRFVVLHCIEFKNEITLKMQIKWKCNINIAQQRNIIEKINFACFLYE